MKRAYALCREYGGMMRIYPGSMELRSGKTYSLTSRTVAVVGIADEICDARRISLDGIRSIKGSSLWYRRDIASEENIMKSIRHMRRLRS